MSHEEPAEPSEPVSEKPDATGPASVEGGGDKSGGDDEPVRFPAALVRRVALISATTAALSAVGLGVKYGLASALSALLGALIGVLNLWALARLVVSLLADSEASTGGAKARAAVLLGLKSVGLITLVGVLVVNGYVQGGALMVGISMVALSIVLAMMWPTEKGAP